MTRGASHAEIELAREAPTLLSPLELGPVGERRLP